MLPENTSGYVQEKEIRRCKNRIQLAINCKRFWKIDERLMAETEPLVR